MTSFSEWDASSKQPIWFALNDDRPLVAFAGIFATNWTSTRKVKEGEVTTDLYAFLTTDPNSIVAPNDESPNVRFRPGNLGYGFSNDSTIRNA